MAVQQIKCFLGNKFLILQMTPSPLPTENWVPGTSIIKENCATGTLPFVQLYPKTCSKLFIIKLTVRQNGVLLEHKLSNETVILKVHFKIRLVSYFTSLLNSN